MPWVVFTDPQVAGVGLSEAAAKAAGHEVKNSIVPLQQEPRALAARNTRGLIKLVADAKTDRLLGGQILAPKGRQHPDIGAGAPIRHDHKGGRRYDIPLPDHGGGAEAHRPDLRQGPGQAPLLRG